MKKFYIFFIIVHSACLGMDTQTPSNSPSNICSLAAQIISTGIKPSKIWPCGDVDFPGGYAISSEGKMWHRVHILGIGIIYAGEITGQERLEKLKSLINAKK